MPAHLDRHRPPVVEEAEEEKAGTEEENDLTEQDFEEELAQLEEFVAQLEVLGEFDEHLRREAQGWDPRRGA